MMQHTNWAGNHTYRAVRWHEPKSVEQAQELVRRHDKLKALGTRHSFNGIADTPADMISLKHFNRVLALDAKRHKVTVEAGVRYGELCRHLHQRGYALHNLASLPHIAVAGACLTATHGSGDRHGNLATIVSALEFITADGQLVEVSHEQHSDQFRGMVVSLGGLGVVTKVTLDLVPAYDMRQDVYENLPLAQLEAHFDAITSSADSVSLFTDWRSSLFQVWLKRRVHDGDAFQPEPEWFGATLAAGDRHPIPGVSAVHCTPQSGIAGPWHERLPHFRLDFTPSSGEELQSEYFVPRAHARAALRAVHELRERIAPQLQVCEVRTVAADDLWMSPCYRRASVGIHFTWHRNWPAVRELLPLIEAQLAPFGARPHWAKLFTASPARVRDLYEKRVDFQSLLESYDPQGKFRNDFLDSYVFGED